MLALLIYPHPFSGETTAVELCWWMEPEHRGSGGLKLLRAAEQKAREAGATKLMLGAPSERTEELYQRLGLERVEVTYQRQL
jgi:GNAT superfamily N-acetyltransferase